MFNPYNVPAPPVYNESKLIKTLDFCVIDTETTGLNPLVDRIVSIACRRVKNGKVLEPFYTLLDPEMVIPPSASSVHGITNYLISQEKAPRLDQVVDNICDYVGDSTIVAHNASFDRSFVNPSVFLENGYTRERWLETPDDLHWKSQFNGVGRDWLCTYRLAHHLYKAHFGYTDISLKNESLRFWLEPHYIPKEKSHNALVDVNTTIHVLMHELSYAENSLGIQSLEELFDLQWQSLATKEMPIGKHKGECIESVPDSYLDWCMQNPDKMGAGLTYELGMMLMNEIERRKKSQVVVQDNFSRNTKIRGNLFNLDKGKAETMSKVKNNDESLVPRANHSTVYDKVIGPEVKKVTDYV